MTSAEIVALTRDLIIEYDQVPMRDGFTADVGNTQSVSILRMVNTILRKMSYLGFNKVSITQDLTIGTYQYTLSGSVIRVVSAYLLSVDSTVTYPLKEMDYDTLDAMKSKIQEAATGRPREWFSRINQVGVRPRPDAAYNLVLETHEVASDLPASDSGASPSTLATYFHDAIAYGAAILIEVMQVENDAAQKRAAALMPFYDSYIEELAAVCRTTPEPARIRLHPGNSPRELFSQRA